MQEGAATSSVGGPPEVSSVYAHVQQVGTGGPSSSSAAMQLPEVTDTANVNTRRILEGQHNTVGEGNIVSASTYNEESYPDDQGYGGDSDNWQEESQGPQHGSQGRGGGFRGRDWGPPARGRSRGWGGGVRGVGSRGGPPPRGRWGGEFRGPPRGRGFGGHSGRGGYDDEETGCYKCGQVWHSSFLLSINNSVF